MKRTIVSLMIGVVAAGLLTYLGLQASAQLARLAFLAFSALLIASVLAVVIGRDQKHRMR